MRISDWSSDMCSSDLCAGDEFDNRNDDRIPELPVCLCIRDLDPPAAVAAIEAHQPRALQWCQAPRSLSRLVHQDLRAVLVVPSCQGASQIVRSKQTESKTIALRLRTEERRVRKARGRTVLY